MRIAQASLAPIPAPSVRKFLPPTFIKKGVMISIYAYMYLSFPNTQDSDMSLFVSLSVVVLD